MSGGGGPGGVVGAQPKVDIVTKNVTHNPGNQTTKRQSDVAVSVPLDTSANFTIGIMVKNNQAATASLVITSPPGMAVVKETPTPMGPEVNKLKAAFPPLAGHRWVAFTGTTPPPLPGPPQPPAPVTNLQTELTVNSNQVARHGFQVIPVLVHYTNDDWVANHYLIGASIIPGSDHKAVMMRAPRGVGQYTKTPQKKQPRP